MDMHYDSFIELRKYLHIKNHAIRIGQYPMRIIYKKYITSL